MGSNGTEAREFFEQLGEFSRRYVENELKLSSAISPWGEAEYISGTPRGAVLHFTADEDLHRVLRWFLKEKYQARSSAHAVVADRRLASQDEFAADLPLVQELPATVIQVREPHTQAWHATWTNASCYGIENVNAGPLKCVSEPSSESVGSFTSWRPRDKSSPEWTMPWSVPYKTAVQLYGRWWAPYTVEQVETNAILLRYVQQLFGTLKRPWIVGHEAVQGEKTPGARGRDKLDLGPHFPIHGVRDAVFDGWKPIERYDWFKHFSGDRKFGIAMRDGAVIEHARVMGSENPNPLPAVAWTRFESAVRALPEKEDFGSTGRTALRLLGYYVKSLAHESLDTEEAMSVWMFQRMMGLKTDSQPGPVTRRALVERLEDRGFLEAQHEGEKT